MRAAEVVTMIGAIARQINYLDFELEIEHISNGAYAVVVHSPAGEARETMQFPFDEATLTSCLKDIHIALLRSGGARRDLGTTGSHAVEEFGKALFNALFVGEVRSRYDTSQRLTEQQNKGLRIKLRIKPPELAILPWEFLYDPREGDFICLSRNTPLVRYTDLPRPVQPLAFAPPLRVLGVTASPNGLESLDVDHEKRRLEDAIKELQALGMLELTWMEGQTWRDLQRTLQHGPWHIFHFIGHGAYDRDRDEGVIALANEDGGLHYLSAKDLGRLLADNSLRIVLLNSCEGALGNSRDIFSSTAATLVRRGIPAVVAMQYEISDRAAIEFSRAFYQALSKEWPIEAAVAEARKAICIATSRSLEWGTPVLFLRSSDGRLFDIKESNDHWQRRELTSGLVEKSNDTLGVEVVKPAVYMQAQEMAPDVDGRQRPRPKEAGLLQRMNAQPRTTVAALGVVLVVFLSLFALYHFRPSLIDGSLGDVEVHRRNKNFKLAQTGLQAIRQVDPNNAKANRLWDELSIQIEDHIRESLEKAAAESKENEPRAMKTLLGILDLDPQNTDAKQMMAEIELRQYDKYISRLTRDITDNPTAYLNYALRFKAYKAHGNEAAAKSDEKVLEKHAPHLLAEVRTRTQSFR